MKTRLGRLRGFQAVSAALCIGLAAGAAAAPPPDPLAATIDKLFEDWNRSDRPGGGVVAVKDGRVVVLRGFGLADLEHALPNTPRTVFDASALLDQVLGLAVATLEEQGKLALGDDVRKWIPELRSKRPLLVRDLLLHTSGLPDFQLTRLLGGERPEHVAVFADVVRLAGGVLQRSPAAPAGAPAPSSTDTMLLVRVIEKVTGQSFHDWAWERLFKPLKMTRTQVRESPREIVERAARGYEHDRQEGYLRGVESCAVPGGAGLAASLEDLGKWLVNLDAMAVGGRGALRRVLEAPATTAGAPTARTYGFGVKRCVGTPCLTHAATWSGFGSAVVVIPAKRVAVVVVRNWDYMFHNPEGAARQVAAALLGGGPGTPGKPTPAAARPKVTVPPAVLDAYVGTWRFEPGLTGDVVRDGEHLEVAMPWGRARLQPRSATTFFEPDWEVELTFERDPDGKVRRVTVVGDGEVTSAPRIERARPTPADLKRCEGEYGLAGFPGRHLVRLKGSALVLRTPAGREMPLVPEAADHFVGQRPHHGLVGFVRRGAKVTGFTLEGEQTRGLLFERLPPQRPARAAP
jgi:CubicO group peptidase (beta-lactamase class C family)